MDTDLDSNKTKIEIIIAVIAIAFVVSILVFLLQKTATKNMPTTSTTTQTESTNANTTATDNTTKPTGVLINQNEKKNLQNKFDQTTKNESGITPEPTVNYDFKYEVDPNLEKKPHSLLPFSPVYAASSCDLTKIPSSANLYVLQNHLSPEEAKIYAEKNGIKAEAAAIPDTTGFTNYVFTDPKITTDYITISEPSGNSVFHHAITTLGEAKDMTTALETSKNKLTNLGLFSNLIAVSSTVNENDDKHRFDFVWQGAWGGLGVIDPVTLKADGATSVCDIKATTTTNYVNVQIALDGTSISNIIEKIRKVKKTLTVPIQSLATSIKETVDTPMLDPEVFSSSTAATTGTVKIDEATLKYIDVGEAVGLSCYIPAYVTGGTVGSTRVVSVFPAIALSAIKDNCLKTKTATGKDISDIFKPDGAAGTLNYSTFTLNEPTLAAAPAAGTCYGNLVDYFATCKTSIGTQVCSGYFSVKPEEDSFDTCTKSCFKPVEDMVMSYSPGSDVCRTFSQSVFDSVGKPLPDTYKSTSSPASKSASSPASKSTPKAQSVVCAFQSCPC